jgi:hypothetical protein
VADSPLRSSSVDIRVRWNLDPDLPNLRISGTVEATVADNYRPSTPG